MTAKPNRDEERVGGMTRIERVGRFIFEANRAHGRLPPDATWEEWSDVFMQSGRSTVEANDRHRARSRAHLNPNRSDGGGE